MISIPGSLSFAKLVMMSSTPAKSAGDARHASQDPFIHGNQRCPIQSRLQSVLGVRSFYVESNDTSGGKENINKSARLSDFFVVGFNKIKKLFHARLLDTR